MCVLAFAWRAHPRWRLVLAGNRDELHARPAQPLHRWTEAPHVLAGRDLKSGGAWLGVSEQGRLAVVTNISGYGPPAPDAPSRGALAADLLTSEGRYAELSLADAGAFNPFHLITVRAGGAALWRNRPEPERRVLGEGVHGLSNGDADRPWPKTLALMAATSRWIEGGGADPEPLLAALGDDVPPPGAAGLTGPAGSAVFVRHGAYGTRCSTVVLVDGRGTGRIVERRFDNEGRITGETDRPFFWPD